MVLNGEEHREGQRRLAKDFSEDIQMEFWLEKYAKPTFKNN